MSEIMRTSLLFLLRHHDIFTDFLQAGFLGCDAEFRAILPCSLLYEAMGQWLLTGNEVACAGLVSHGFPE